MIKIRDIDPEDDIIRWKNSDTGEYEKVPDDIAKPILYMAKRMKVTPGRLLDGILKSQIDRIENDPKHKDKVYKFIHEQHNTQ